MDDILMRLAAPFPPPAVQWRVTAVKKDGSKGQAACYIDARDVQMRLDEVCGPDWQDELIIQPSGLVTCRIGIYIEGVWRWRMDATAAVRENKPDGQKLDAKDEQQREMSQKGAASDAFKRAAVKWGIGRYLYSIDAPWVQIDEYRGIARDEKQRLRAILDQHWRQWNGRNEPLPATPTPLRQVEALPTAALPTIEEARKNPDFARIELLLRHDGDTHGEINRIIAAEVNRAAIDSWPEPMKELMRQVVREMRERSRPPAQQAA